VDEQRVAFIAALRKLADQLEGGELVDAIAVVGGGWSGHVQNPLTLVTPLFDALCTMRDLQRMMQMQQQAKEQAENAARIVVPTIGKFGPN
jgi:hypothetical protein